MEWHYAAGHTVDKFKRSYYEVHEVDDDLDFARDPDEEPDDSVPYVAIGVDEKAPWEGLPLMCPMCGRPRELLDSTPPGLTYIKCCGGVWLRGRPRFEEMFGRKQP